MARTARVVDVLNNPYYGTQQSYGEGGGSTGNGNGAGYFNFSPFGQDFTQYQDNQTDNTGAQDAQKTSDWLKSKNYSLMDDDESRWIQNSSGQVVGEKQAVPKDKTSLRNLAILAAVGLGGGALAGYFGGAAAGGAAAGGASGGAAAGAAGGAAGGAGAAGFEVAGLLAGGAPSAGTFGASLGAGAGAGLVAPSAAGLGAGLVAPGAAAGSSLFSGAGALAAAAEGASALGGTTAPGYSAAANYGAGMSGAQTGAFDAVLGATGSKGAAATVANAIGGDVMGAIGSGADWLKSGLSQLPGTPGGGGGGLGSGWLRDLLGLAGAGVQQWNVERMAKDGRDWQSAEKDKDRAYTDRKETEKRARQAPVRVGKGSLSVFRKG